MPRHTQKAISFFAIICLLLGSCLFITASAEDFPFRKGPSGEYALGPDGLELYSPTWQQAVTWADDVDDYDPESYVLEADVTCLSGVDVASGCRMGFILFADENAGSYVYFTIDAWNTNASRGFQVNSMENGVEKGLGGQEARYCFFDSVPGTTYHLAASVEGGQVSIFVDGSKLLTVTVPEVNRYGDCFGLVSCVGRACFDGLILDDTYLWTSDGKAGETVPKQTETDSVKETGDPAETERPSESEKPSETEKGPDTSSTETSPAPARDKNGTNPFFWLLLCGAVLIPGGISFLLFFMIGSKKKGQNGGDGQ